MEIKNVYTSIACNRDQDALDWGQNGLIVFGAFNAIALMDPNYYDSCKIIKTYVQHTKKVSCVKWIQNPENEKEYEIISGSDDGTAILWNIKNLDEPIYHILQEHESGVNVIDAIYDTNKKLIIATASTDSTIKLWNFNNETQKYESFQTISLISGFCFAIKIMILPIKNQILFAYAGDDENIYLLTETKSNINQREFIITHKLVGHEDWVRSIDCIQINEFDLLLATGSQDSYVRLWEISTNDKNNESNDKVNKLNTDESKKIQIEPSVIELKNEKYFSTKLDSVLSGHEGWVYSVHWKKFDNQFYLLSTSMDKTIVIWSQGDKGIWMEKIRLGGVGGNSLGFYGGKFSSNGKSVIAYGYQGSFHMWSQSEINETEWIPQIIVGGHFGSVRDLDWEPSGQFLITVSADQTTRVHAPWIRKLSSTLLKKDHKSNNDDNNDKITWHEIARPQIHGYDMQCITILSRYKFASGAEEKIIRTFQATTNFIENFRRICNVEDDKEGDELLKNLPKGASVPSLGLSNKAVFNLDSTGDSNLIQKREDDMYPENYFVPTELNSPPQEETLMQNTLWPETQKLYGHGFEIYSICASSDGKLLASSCRATSIQHAQIIIWDTITWKQIQKLSSHSLTVTQLKFSPNNQYLLSVSRDRRWTLFENKSSNTSSVAKSNFELIAKTNKDNQIHNRIIWACDWSSDSKLFCTTSRDGKAIIWHKTNTITDSSLKEWKSLSCLELKGESITAVSFHLNYTKQSKENSQHDKYLIALGFETGKISIYKFSYTEWNQIYILNKQCAHHAAVRKLQFRPIISAIQLASCGDDNLVRIYEFQIQSDN